MTLKDPIEVKRIVHYAEGDFSLRRAKMSVGVIRYGIHESVAVIDSTQAGKTSQEVIGAGGDLPLVASLEKGMEYQPEVLLIGITPVGGRLNDQLRAVILEAISRGLDVYAGLHDFLTHDPEITAAAADAGVRLKDLRKPAHDLPVGKGRCRHAKSKVVLTVGSDAATGKMTVALEVQRELIRRGVNAEFIATGQVGIAIAGWGSPIDAIAGDFIAGAVERDILAIDGQADVILVEGQGSLLHPGFSSVTLGLLHGACPDAIILNHQITRTEISNMETSIPIPPLDQVAKLYLDIMAPIQPTKLIACTINSAGVDEAEARAYIETAENLLGVPTEDVVRFGSGRIADAIQAL